MHDPADSTGDAEAVRLSMSLRVFSEDLDPEWVTSGLGVAPTLTYRKGDGYHGPDGRLRSIYKQGMWIHDVEERIDERIIGERLLEFVRIFEARKNFLKQAVEDGIRADVFVGVFDSEGIFPMKLSNDLLRTMGAMGLELDVSVYEREARTDGRRSDGGSVQTEFYQLDHEYEDLEGFEHVKFLGIYSSEELAVAARDSLLKQPGFSDHPEGFCISKVVLDRVEWSEGFVRAGDI
ncbi:DUF4279 domain-containing protein [Luteolibacter ambystomatis]|uniref:DUF4279 domain-containing protein n=1 Tax=Luteolibacter ambystomatis TaxID=2824561 RepID=A0A975PH72_9BACT|nr:DUF4279 domain-containing protein [Luteolibacter ambystomatis]QUE52991.1 DUF4279 domain-containing protein [Luteolibacter ambystomatis]